MLASAEEFECKLRVETWRSGDHCDIDVGVGGERCAGVMANKVGEVSASCIDPIGGGIRGSNEGEASSFCGGQAVQIAHAAERSVTHHGEAERCRRRNEGWAQETADERAECCVALECDDVGHTCTDDPTGTHGADNDRRLVVEPDAGRRSDGDIVGGRLQRAEYRGNRHFAREPDRLGSGAEGDEPFGPRKVGGHGDATQVTGDLVAGLDGHEYRAASFGVGPELAGLLGIQTARNDGDGGESAAGARSIEVGGNM